jgi:lauroyl/myristoyl acyltransferase
MTTTASERQPERAHAPALGVTHRLLGRFHVTGIFWYRLHYWTSIHFPRWFMNQVGPVVISFAFCLVMGRIRNAVAANLEPVLGPAGPVTRFRRAYRTLRTFACCLTERYQRMAASDKTQFSIDGVPYWREATGDGRGAVLVSAHLGPWENSTYLGADEEARIVHVVREEEIDPRAQAFISEMVGKISDKVVTHYAGDDPRLAIELSEALRRGELVALQADRPRAGGRTIATRIFGKPMPLPIGPVALARAAGVPLLPVFSFREGVLMARTVIRPPIMVARTANRDADHSAAANQLAAEIEWAIRERPYQWFCFKKLWE